MSKKKEARSSISYAQKWLWPGTEFSHVGPAKSTPPDWWRIENEYLEQLKADAETQTQSKPQ